MKKLSLGLALWLGFFAVSRFARAESVSPDSFRVAGDDVDYDVDASGEIAAPPPLDSDMDESQSSEPASAPVED